MVARELRNGILERRSNAFPVGSRLNGVREASWAVMRAATRLVFLVCGLTCVGGCCSTSGESLSHNGGLIHERNEGYSLLYQLMGDESDVSKLFILKHVDESVGGLVKEISGTSQAAKLKLDGFFTPQSRIEFDVSDLPKTEQASRELERKRQTKELLFSSGKAFELQLIFSQAEATEYAANLCQAIATLEDDPGRKDFLTKLAGEFAGYRDRLMGLLDVKG